MKVKPFCRCVHLDILRCSVVLLCGDLKDPALRAAYDREMRRVKAPKDCPSYDKITEPFSGTGSDAEYTAATSCNYGNGDCIIHLHEWSSGTFVHEVFHAVSGIMESRGVTDTHNETGAYTMEYLFEQFVNTDWADRNFVERHSLKTQKKGK